MPTVTLISKIAPMKKRIRLPLIAAFLLIFLASACTNKSLDLDVSQRGCSLFTIFAPSYATLSDPSCTGTPLVASYDITFSYQGDDACLHRIVIDSETKVKNGDGNVIASATYVSALIDTSALVAIDRAAKKITFRFDITFQNAADADSYNDAYIVFHCENSEGQATRPAILHIYGGCALPPKDIGNPVHTYNVHDDTIRVKLWDNASQDGDIVSIYLNGQWVLLQYMLTNTPRTFRWPIIQGQNNDLILVAINQGSSGPNTCSISINGRGELSLNLDLETGAMIRIL
jgi:hypothetical protein